MARHRSETRRGAVAPLFAVAAVALMTCAAYAVDVGNAWQARRQLQTAADAASLAAARQVAVGATDACPVAESVARENAAQAKVVVCRAGASGVAVGLVREVPLAFAPVFGQDSATVRAATSARAGNPSAADGLRPLGLCEKAVAISQWLATGPTPVSTQLTIPYTKSSPDDCGANAPGNWGVLDFDGGSNSNAETDAWLAGGYPGRVRLGDRVPGNTGVISTSLETSLSSLKTAGTVFQLPLYSAVEGSGSNSRFTVSGFVAVRITGYKLSGTSAQRSITLQFLRRAVPGEIGGATPSPGLTVDQICRYDTSGCAP